MQRHLHDGMPLLVVSIKCTSLWLCLFYDWRWVATSSSSNLNLPSKTMDVCMSTIQQSKLMFSFVTGKWNSRETNISNRHSERGLSISDKKLSCWPNRCRTMLNLNPFRSSPLPSALLWVSGVSHLTCKLRRCCPSRRVFLPQFTSETQHVKNLMKIDPVLVDSTGPSVTSQSLH